MASNYVLVKNRRQEPNWRGQVGGVPRLQRQATLISMERSRAKGQNLTEAEVQRRLRGGIVFLFLALLAAVLLEHSSASWFLRLSLFVPFYFAGDAFFAAVHRTCGVAALRGMRATGEGSVERIADPNEREQCLCVGKRQIVHTVIGSALMTAAFVFIG